MMLESFVAMELLRQTDCAQEPVSLFHYRDNKQREVDVILERNDGEIAGIEVKASATATAADFAGLRYLRDKLGARFKAGLVLYAGGDPALRGSPGRRARRRIVELTRRRASTQAMLSARLLAPASRTRT